MVSNSIVWGGRSLFFFFKKFTRVIHTESTSLVKATTDLQIRERDGSRVRERAGVKR